MNARNLNLYPLVEGINVAITKTNGDRVAGEVVKVLMATKAQGLRYKIRRNAVAGDAIVEAVDILEFFTY